MHTSMKTLTSSLIAICMLVSIFSSAQDERLAANKFRKASTDQSIASHIPSKNIGPTVFSGRVSDIAVNPSNPSEFYVAYASGGLWHTNNNGTSFTPKFDHEAVMTIGDIAVDWDTKTIWVGTGEVNSSRSSYAGVGMYKSTDAGESWIHLGLTDSHHIGRIVLHPTETNTAWVAVLGHLYTTNQERGIYKTTDGGSSWKKTLFVNDNSGAVDLIIDPNDHNTLYAATWDRIRHAWDFQESGTGSGIYKSTDGGTSWDKMNTDTSGFPNNDGTGRIGLDIATADGTTYLYAILDNYNRRPKEPSTKTTGITKSDFEGMSRDQFLQISDDDLQDYLSANNFPRKYTPASVKAQVRADKIGPIALKEYVENANSLLFDTPVIGAEVYLSTDGAVTWKKTHEGHLDGVYNSYGYYFGQIRVDPTDPMRLYIMGVPIVRSDDGGATWTNISAQNVHADHHALWINPKMSSHIINGNDGGINISYDYGATYIKCNSPSVGQFYYINVDNAEPYNVYGGTQDNGVWVGSHNYRKGVRWHMNGDYPYQAIMGGDGMQVQIDNRDNNTVYTGFQFGNYFRIDKSTEDRTYITPKHELGDRPYRWNWQSPILLSPHNQDILYMGANKLLRSMDQGTTFTEVSEDLTTGGKKGDVAYGTITTISESQFQFGLIYVGTDDGRVWRTKNGGASWTDLGEELPAERWASRIVASSHQEGRVYLSLNGYRNDDFASYVYMSDNYGDTWTSISQSLPSEPVNVIKEDPSSADIVYVGTDHGTYVSIDQGATFGILDSSMPRTPVHDLVVQARDKHLLVGTHGRSIYKVDIEPLQNISKAQAAGLHLYSISEMRARSGWGNSRNQYSKPYEPSLNLTVYSNQPGEAKLSIMADGKEISNRTVNLKKGLQSIAYDMTIDASNKKRAEKCLSRLGANKSKVELKEADNGLIYLLAGTYNLQIKQGAKITEQQLKLN